MKTCLFPLFCGLLVFSMAGCNSEKLPPPAGPGLPQKTAQTAPASAAASEKTPSSPVSPQTTEQKLAADRLGINREPVNQRDFPPTPADGATVKVTPTPFAWLKPLDWRPGKYTYTLQYSRHANFPGDATFTVGNTPFHNYLPPQALKPGKWFWRWAVETPQFPVWSKTRSFTVAPDAEVNLWPNHRKLLAMIPRQHPRAEISSAEIAKLRRRAATGDLQPVTERMKAAFETWGSAPALKEPEFLPPRQSSKWGPAFRRVMGDVRTEVDRMDVGRLLFLLTGEKKYAEETRRRVVNCFANWDPNGSTALLKNDEPAMSLASVGVCVYDTTYDFYTPEERAAIEKSILIRLNQLYDYLKKRPFDANPYESHSNHYLKSLGISSMILAHEHPELLDYLDFSVRNFYTTDPVYGSPDGGFNEGPAYGSWGVARRLRYIRILKKATGFDMMKKEFFRNCGYFQLIPWPCRTRLPGFGDGYSQFERSSHASQARMLRLFAAMTGDPIYLKAAQEVKLPPQWDLGSLMVDAAKLGVPNLSKLPTAWQFPGIGLAALRNDLDHYDNDIGLLFQSNPFGSVSHNHNAQNCFMLEAYTEPLLIASGHYDYYSSPHHAQWCWETKSQNGITVDGGKGQKRGGNAVGKLTEFQAGSDFDIVTGDASAAYEMLDKSLRTIVHVKPGFYVIYDRNTAKTPHIYEYNLHAENPGVFDEAAQTLTVRMPHAGVKVLFFGQSPWKFRAFDKFPVPPYRKKATDWPEQWHFVASAPVNAPDMELITVLLPFKKGGEAELPKVERMKDGVKFTFRDGTLKQVRFDGGKVITESGR